MFLGLTFISTMTAKDTNYTLGEESTSWLTYTSENLMLYLLVPIFSACSLFVFLYFPVIIGLFIFYMNALFINCCKKFYNLPDDPDSEQWRKPQQIHAFVINMIARLWNGYEICGMENIPKGPAVLVYYHGSLPADYFFFVPTIYRMTGRLMRSVVERFFFVIPGLRTYGATEGASDLNREECVAVLKKGHLLGIAPGGLREQNLGDHNYKLIWRNRNGFAHIATEAKVPVIPVFTQNIREAYRVYGNTDYVAYGYEVVAYVVYFNAVHFNIAGLMRWLYERTRLLIFPVLGPFPVKLRTHIGEPIPYDPNITAEELFEKSKHALEALIKKHQKIPGSILSALWERFEVHRKEE